MKVQCKFCEHEESGLCSAKAKRGQPIAVKINKRRMCDSYSEDAYKVLASYRKGEAHKANIKSLEKRRAQLSKAMEMARKAGLKIYTESSND